MLLKLDVRNNLIIFGSLGSDGKFSKAKFDGRRYAPVKKLFESGLHKILLTVNTNSVVLYVDCEQVKVKKMRPKESHISTKG
jgi:hypothetical protein